MRHFISLAVLLVGLMAVPAFAEAPAAQPAPTRESLVAFWEKNTKAGSEVKTFEPSKEAGVYNFETTFFPYKGRLKLLNSVVTPYEEGYYDGLYTGIIEVELPDAPESFFKKFAASYSAWTRQNYFYYDAKGAVWFPASEFSAWSKDYYKRESATASAPAASCMNTWWGRNASTLIYIVFLCAVIGFVVLLARKQNKKIWDNHSKALSEQQRGLAIAEKSVIRAEESLKHQVEHTRLLTEILAALKK